MTIQTKDYLKNNQFATGDVLLESSFTDLIDTFAEEAPINANTYGRSNGSWVTLTSVIHSFGITVDGAGAVVTTGSKGFATIPYDCTINNWYLVADQSGSVVIDIKRSGTSIVGTGNIPTLSAQQSNNASVSGWTSVAITTGDILEFEITGSPATITRVNLVIKGA